MPKNRQQSVPVEKTTDGRNRQETAHSNCYISLAWWEHSPTVQLGTVRPDGIVAEREYHHAKAQMHVIADGTQADQSNEPGWFVHLDEAGLKAHIAQCRRAGRRVFGWSKNTRDRQAQWDQAMEQYAEPVANHGWIVQPDGLDVSLCLLGDQEPGGPLMRSPHYGHVWEYDRDDTSPMWCPGVPR